MTATILISGAGQLGSRYLQGLAQCRTPLKIYVQDTYQESLDRASGRWNEVANPATGHEVSFHAALESLPDQIDIAIVATTADVRPAVVGEIARIAAVRYWVLEKVLAQSEHGLDELIEHTRGSRGAWVNTARRTIAWHQQIKGQLGLSQPMTLEVDGGLWGLACNAVHFLDLLAWWTDETLDAVVTAQLNRNWFESKRPGFWEVTGALEARFSDGSRAVISCRDVDAPMSLKVSDGRISWLINEAGGVARRSDGIEIRGRVEHQSERSASLVDCILEGGTCALPTLAESAMLHRVFIRGMLEHWRRAGHPAATGVPIT